MKEFVSYFDNVIDRNYCQSIIDRFEAHEDEQVETVMEDHRSFKEINLNEHEEWKDVIETLLDKIQNVYLKKYMIEHKVDSKSWPPNLGFEQFRMKRYLPNGKDEFQFHVDAADLNSCSRFLVCFFYLNDVKEGGETAFQPHRMLPITDKVKPVSGRLLMFPPMWTHPHIGMKPISGPKYIVGTYLRYV